MYKNLNTVVGVVMPVVNVAVTLEAMSVETYNSYNNTTDRESYSYKCTSSEGWLAVVEAVGVEATPVVEVAVAVLAVVEGAAVMSVHLNKCHFDVHRECRCRQVVCIDNCK